MQEEGEKRKEERLPLACKTKQLSKSGLLTTICRGKELFLFLDSHPKFKPLPLEPLGQVFESLPQVQAP